MGTARGALTSSYVSPKTKSVALFVETVNGVAPSPPLYAFLDVASSTPGCTVSTGSIACTVTLSVPTGSVAFSVRTYAQPAVAGNPISIGKATVPVTAGANIDIPVNLRAVVTTYSYSFSPQAGPIDQPFDFTLSATARDSAGDVIGGTDPYYLPLQITTQDTSGHVTSTPALPTQLTAPGQTVAFHYDGLGKAATYALQLGAQGDALTAGEAPTSGAVRFTGGGRHLYVVSQFAHAIYVYDIAADGSLSGPSRTITGDKTGLTNPITIAVDALGAIYVVNIFDSFIVFGPGADGNVAPQTTISTST
ncbi:MAG TPA: hypothetical protein VIJ15_02070, partial [Dermatophilaceae bacterium]